MADVNINKSGNIRKDDSVIHEQTNPSFHDTPEDAKNYKSLQNKAAVKKSNFMLKPSLLTQKAEQIRTDKAAVSAVSNNISNKFLVLGDNSKDLTNVPNSDQPIDKKDVSETGFVFGENIFSRVMKHDSSKPSEESAKQFKDLVCNNNDEDSNTRSDNDALRKSADELSQKQITQQYEEAEIITGEEEETNVLKTLCKLFLFNPEKNEWIEKGFCNIHLNDMTDEQINSKIKSRLVVRSKGGLKVLVNTLIWSDMGLARASPRAVRITAQSEDGIKSFLLTMQNVTDADLVYYALLNRKTRLAKEANIPVKNTDRKREFIDSDDNQELTFDTKKRILETKDNGNDEENDS